MHHKALRFWTLHVITRWTFLGTLKVFEFPLALFWVLFWSLLKHFFGTLVSLICTILRTFKRRFLFLSVFSCPSSSIPTFVTHSLTHWLTHSLPFSKLEWWTLACEDAYSKLVKVVTVADVDGEDQVGSSLFHIWELMFGP